MIDLMNTMVQAGPAKDSILVTGIHLFKAGGFVVVNAEIDGVWVEVIRERADGSFSHIVEPGGMLKAALAKEVGE